MIVVVDASTVVAALVDTGSAGVWAEQLLQTNEVIAPSLIQVECTNVLRRLLASGQINDLNAAMAHRNLMLLPIELFSFEPFAQRVWNLRDNVSSHDAWYVAIAEQFDAPLATLDARLINAPGPDCQFMTPEISD